MTRARDAKTTDSATLVGVVVTFHPGEEVRDNLQAMVRECGRVLVVDNGSAPEACRQMAAVPGVQVLALGSNLGVGVALNRGAAWAREAGHGWMVTFDQDSTPEPGMVAGMWAAHLRHPAAAVVGPVIREGDEAAPDYRWVRRHPRCPVFFQRAVCRDGDLPEVTMIITSGSMIDLDVWRELGGFAGELFIDYVDIDYCLRVLRAGRTIAVATGTGLRHKLGARQAARLLGQDLRPMHHAAFRHYYMARNRVVVWRRHALAVPHWAAFDFCFAWYNLARVLVFESSRGAKVRAILRGTWHGLRGLQGPMP